MISGRIGPKPHSPLPQPSLQEMSTPLADLTGNSRLDTPNSELSDPGFPLPPETGDAEDHHHSASESAGNGGCMPECKRPDTPTDRAQFSQSFPYFPVGPQHYLSAQQLATAVAAGLSPTPPCLNQPVLLPFNMGGQLGGHQGLVVSVPSPSLASIQGLMAAVAAGGVMTLPLQSIQATSPLNVYLQHMQKLQLLHRQKQDPQQQHQIQQQRLQYQQHLQHQQHQQQLQIHVQQQEKHHMLHQRQQQQQLPRQEQPHHQQQQQHQKHGQQCQHDLQHLRQGQQKEQQPQQHLPDHIPQHGQLHLVQPPNHGQDHQEHPPNHGQDHQEHPPNHGQDHQEHPPNHGQLHKEQPSNHGQQHHEQEPHHVLSREQPLHHGRIHQEQQPNNGRLQRDPQYQYGQDQQQQPPYHEQLCQERQQRQQNEHQQVGPLHLTLDRHATHPRLTPPDPRQSPSSSTPSSSSHELRRTSPSLPDSTSPPQRRGYSSPGSMNIHLPPPSPAQLSNQMAGGSTAIGSTCGTHIGTAVPGLQGVSGQLVTNAQGQIIGAIPLMPNTASQPNQAGGGASGLPVQPITPQLLTNTQGQIIATVIGNQILPVINTQGITLSPVKPGQQLLQAQQGPVGPTTACQHHRPHSVDSISQSAIQQDCSASSSPSPSCLGVGQLVNDPPGGPGEMEAVNLEEIREFAKAFRIRRLSLGLTQSQVGEALSAAESPAYSQSAICRHAILRGHFLLPQEVQDSCTASGLTAKLNPALLYPGRFEKLDITPKSAQKIKPVLERWMAEAEARHRSGIQNLSELMSGETAKKRKRRTSFTPQALEVLNGHFERNTHPSGQEMTEIAEQLNYDREVVRVWFCNKRQALKNTIKRLKPAEIDSTVTVESLTDALMDPLDGIS